MWNGDYWAADFWARDYWAKTGTGARSSSNSNQYLPLLGVGAWLIGMVLAQHLTALISSLPR